MKDQPGTSSLAAIFVLLSLTASCATKAPPAPPAPSVQLIEQESTVQGTELGNRAFFGEVHGCTFKVHSIGMKKTKEQFAIDVRTMRTQSYPDAMAKEGHGFLSLAVTVSCATREAIDGVWDSFASVTTASGKWLSGGRQWSRDPNLPLAATLELSLGEVGVDEKLRRVSIGGRGAANLILDDIALPN